MRHLLLALAATLLPFHALAAPPTLEAHIVWSSARDGGVNKIFRMKADGTGITQLTKEEADYPRWSPSGKFIMFTSNAAETGVEQGDATKLFYMRPDGTDRKEIPLTLGSAEWTPDGRGIVGSQGDSTNRSLVYAEWGSWKTTTLMNINDECPPLKGIEIGKVALSSDRRYLLVMNTRFHRQKGSYTAANGRYRASGGWAAAVVDLADKTKLYWFGDGCQPMTPPWGDKIYHVNNGGGIISEMNLPDLMDPKKSYKGITKRDKDLGWAYCPAVSTDNQFLTYVGCLRHDSWGTGDYDVYVQRLDQPNGERVRLAKHLANDRWPHMYVGPLQVAANVRTPPAAPTNLTAANTATPKTVTLKWRDNAANESGYYLERKPANAPATAFTQILVLPPNATSHTVTLDTPNDKFTFRVRATNIRGDSAYTNEATNK